MPERALFPFAVLCCAFVAAAASAEPSERPPAQARPSEHRLDDQRWLAEPVHVENLTVWPIATTEAVPTGDYLTLAEATARGLAEVREKSGSGQVNELVLHNEGERPILVLGGTILKGGKQDRQVSDDFVVAPKSTTPVGAFCVERGRWSASRQGRSTAGKFQVMPSLAAKKVRASAQYGHGQSEVWKQVDAVNSRARVAPSTQTFLATLEEDDRKARRLRRQLRAAARAHFDALRPGAEIVGVAYAVNGEPLAARAFANEALLFSHLDTLHETMALEAQVASANADDRAFLRAKPEHLLSMIREIDAAAPVTRETKAANRLEVRVNERGGHARTVVSSGAVGFALTEDWTAAPEVSGETRARLERLGTLGYTD